jgi:hypothetical protein
MHLPGFSHILKLFFTSAYLNSLHTDSYFTFSPISSDTISVFLTRITFTFCFYFLYVFLTNT